MSISPLGELRLEIVGCHRRHKRDCYQNHCARLIVNADGEVTRLVGDVGKFKPVEDWIIFTLRVDAVGGGIRQVRDL